MALKSDNVEFEYSILKMATGINTNHHYLHISNCDDIGQC